jgi:hypothetical protein
MSTNTLSSNQSYVKAGKKKTRGELRLPNMYFIMADDWMNKLGHEVFCAWLKLYTYVDRRNEYIETDGGHIPYSFESTASKLGVSESKFYRLIKPLWEFGLIDIFTYEKSQRSSNKPRNIIVYDYPQNNPKLSTEPLAKCRDWKKDYSSSYKLFGMKGGRPKKESDQEEKIQDGIPSPHPFKIKRVGPFKIKRVTLSKMKAINVSNNLFHVLYKLNNGSNKKNLSIYDKVKNLNIDLPIKKTLLKQIDRLKSDYLPVIEIKFNAYKDQIDAYKFADVLSTVLSRDIKSNFSNYLDRSLNTYLENRSKYQNKKQQPIRTEKLPEGYDQPNTSPEGIDFNSMTVEQLLEHRKFVQSLGQEPSADLDKVLESRYPDFWKIRLREKHEKKIDSSVEDMSPEERKNYFDEVNAAKEQLAELKLRRSMV